MDFSLFTNAIKASDIRTPGHPDLANIIRLDLGCVPMTGLMERAGMEIDIPYLHDLSGRISNQMLVVAKDIHSYVPQSVLDKFVIDSINIDSPDQVSELLFNALKIGAGKKLKMTKTGDRVSTGKKQLEAYREAHPVMPLMLEYRELSKLKSTYVDKLPRIAVVHPKSVECPLCGWRHWTDSPRVHTRIVGTRTSTGRYASRPNLQNIPVRTKLGQEVRAAFVAGMGYKLVCADYGQIELRLLAHFSNEPRMQDVFWANGDLHTYTASLIFNKKMEFIDPIFERLPAKSVGFAIAYGETDKGLHQQMMITKPPPSDPRSKGWAEMWSLPNCTRFLEQWHSAYPAVLPYMKEQHYRARRYGFVYDLFGGIRRIPQVKSHHEHVQEEGLRAAGNMQIQGTAAGIMKLSMILLTEDIEDRLEWSRPLMTIHDELIHQAEEDRAENFGVYVKLSMEEAGNNGGTGEAGYRFRVPIKCEEKVSGRWKK